MRRAQRDLHHLETLLFFVFLAVLVNTSAFAGEIRGFWRGVTPLPAAKQEVAVASLHNKVYVMGGLGPGGGTRVDIYNVVEDRWEEGPSLPVGHHHGGAAALDGKVYSIGGFSTASGSFFGMPLADVYELDPERGEWIEKAPLPRARGAHTVAVLGNNVYSIGGRLAGPSISDVSVYDPTLDTWKDLTPMPTPRDHLASGVMDGKILVVGGRSVDFAGTGRLEVLDPVAGTWETRSPMPTARSGHAAAVVGNVLLAFGGEIPGIFAQTEAYDPVSDRWYTLDPMPVPKHGMVAAVLDNRILLPAGATLAGLGPTTRNDEFVVLADVSTRAQIAAGPKIESQLLVGNPGEQAANLRVELYGDDGEDLMIDLGGAGGSQLTLKLAPRSVTSLETHSAGVTSTGSALIFSDSRVSADVLFKGPLGFAGVGRQSPCNRFFVAVQSDADAGVDSALAIADTSGLANSVRLELRDSTGFMIAEAPIDLEPFGHLARFLRELYPEVELDSFEGSITGTSQGEVGALAILMRTNQMATLDVERDCP